MESENTGTFLLGAGFSKAIADGPLMRELYSNMQGIYQREKERKDVLGGNNRVLWFEDLVAFTKGLGTLEDTFCDNLEYLVTLLDLRIDPTNDGLTINDIDIGDPTSFPLEGWTKERLVHIRDVLATYLFLCLEPLQLNETGIRFAERIKKQESILTFNYDLVLEKAVWKVGSWTPNDGYVGISEFEFPDDGRKLGPSPIGLVKLHGSLNWLSPQDLPKENVRITLDNLENWNFFFENLQEILDREPKKPSGPLTREMSKGYAGGIHPYWFLPSYIKPFESRNELKCIWEKASKIFEGTTNLIIIGYSFPEADKHTKSLFRSSLPKNCEIMVVDPAWESLVSSIKGLGFSRITCVETLEQWLEITR